MSDVSCISAEDLERARRDITQRGLLLSRQDSLSLIHEIEHLKRLVGTGRALFDAQAEQVGELIAEWNELRALLQDRSPLFQDFEDAKAENGRLVERIAELKAACYQEIPSDVMPTMSGYACLLCGWDADPSMPDTHEPSCVLYEAAGEAKP